jgi:hypothetical protein
MYKFLIKEMFSQTFLTKVLTVKSSLQSFLRHALQKNVTVTFAMIRLARRKNVNFARRTSPVKRYGKRFFKKSSSHEANMAHKTHNKWLRGGQFSRIRLHKRMRRSSYALHYVKRFARRDEYRRLHRKYPNFKKKYFHLIASLYRGDAKLFNHAFCGMFKYLKVHKHFLRFIERRLKKYLGLPIFGAAVGGIFIKIRGKLNGNDRRKTFYLKIGKPVKPQLIFNDINYNFATVETYTGSFGIRTWFMGRD